MTKHPTIGVKDSNWWNGPLQQYSPASMIGSFEECVPLVPIVVALAVDFGWNALTRIGMSLLAAGCGFAAGVCNPFTIGVAQQLGAHHARITVIADHKPCLVRSFFRLAEMHDSSGRIPYPNPAWPPMHRRHIPLRAVPILSG